MADTDRATPAVDGPVQPDTLRDLTERFLGRIIQCPGFRRSLHQPQTGPRPSSSPHRATRVDRKRPARSPRERNRINRRPDPRNVPKRSLMPFLSDKHCHKQHDECFVEHLIDAVRLHKMLSRLEEEQTESEEHILDLEAKSLGASIALDVLRKKNMPLFASIIEGHEACIKTSAESVEKGEQSDIDRKEKLRRVRLALMQAIQGLFDTIDDYLRHDKSIALEMGFAVALRQYKESLRRCEAADSAYKSLRPKHAAKRRAEETNITEESESQDPRFALAKALRSLTASRALCDKLQRAFFVDYAIGTAGDRAELPHDLTTENLTKHTAQHNQHPQQGSPSTDSDLRRQPGRDIEGRPLDNGSRLPPPLDPHLHQFYSEYRETKRNLLASDKRKHALFVWYAREHAKCLVADPRVSVATFERLFKPEGRPFRQVWEEHQDDKARRRDEHSDSRDRMKAAMLETFQPTDVTPEPCVSDYHTDSLAPTVVEEMQMEYDPRHIRHWQRGIAIGGPPSPSYRQPAPVSFIQLRSYPTWPFAHLENAGPAQPEQILLEHQEAMAELRLEAESTRDKFLREIGD